MDVPGRVSLGPVSGRIVEQVVGAPVCGEVPLGPVSETSLERVVDVPVRGQVRQITLSERIVEQVVDVSMPSVEPVSVQDPQLARPPTGAAASSMDAPLEHFDGVFCTTPAEKKCEHWAAVDCQSRRGVELIPYGGLWQ